MDLPSRNPISTDIPHVNKQAVNKKRGSTRNGAEEALKCRVLVPQNEMDHPCEACMDETRQVWFTPQFGDTVIFKSWDEMETKPGKEV